MPRRRLRNAGNGTAVLQGWRAQQRLLDSDRDPSPLEAFRPQIRDLYIGSGDIGFWQAAIRDPSDPDYPWLREAVDGRSLFLIELLYSDHEGGQRAVGLFTLAPGQDHHWLCSVVRHWNLDRPNPR